jgi:hypothetical protein
MVAKMLLPAYGGTPAVWNTSMVFFQAALLLGYGYAHLSFRFLGPRLQPVVHLFFLGACTLALPIAMGEPATQAASAPAVRLLSQLALGVGLPFVAVSAGAPLLQRWFASASPGARDPYYLYAASNAASILALLAYPIVLEPMLSLKAQAEAWRFAFYGLLVLVLGCVALTLRSPAGQPLSAERPEVAEAVSWRQALYWIALSFVPSSLLLGVTTYLTTNIASAPLLWVVPLAIYLATFVLAFSSRRKYTSSFLGRIVSMLMAPMVLIIVLEATDPILALGSLHLFVFFVGALMCHSRLHETRPAASQLTAFYFWISVGGVLGGSFNALVAPSVFESIAEYPIALVALVMLVPRESPTKANAMDWLVPAGVGLFTVAAQLASNAFGLEPSPVRTGLTLGIPALLAFAAAERPLRYGLSLGAVFLAARFLNVGTTGEVLLYERSFFGVHRVLTTNEGRFRELMHGNTIHGRQSTEPAKARVPLTYYHRTGPIGQVFEALQEAGTLRSAALVGMGVGTLAAYGRNGQTLTFYEIDPDVVHIARDSGLFTFIRDSLAEVNVVLGDARLSMSSAQSGAYDLIVLDAFSSDSIPTHLLTMEAVQMYRDKLAPGGIVAFHVSNRYLELKPILAAAARELQMAGKYQDDIHLEPEEAEEGKYRSTWVILASRQQNLAPFDRDARWIQLEAEPGDRPWTDDYSNLIGAFLARSKDEG